MCWSSRRPSASPSSFRCATAECSSRRSPSTAARRRSWLPISQATPDSGIWVQACGDAHLSNFGAYAAPDRTQVADVNDFDETLPGPWEWDLKRLAASFEIGGRDRGFKDADRSEIARIAVRAYREHMRELAGLSNLDVWYRRVDIDQIRAAVATEGSKEERKRFEQQRRQVATERPHAGLWEAH